jgi:hypothetical protein
MMAERTPQNKNKNSVVDFVEEQQFGKCRARLLHQHSSSIFHRRILGFRERCPVHGGTPTGPIFFDQAMTRPDARGPNSTLSGSTVWHACDTPAWPLPALEVNTSTRLALLLPTMQIEKSPRACCDDAFSLRQLA